MFDNLKLKIRYGKNLDFKSLTEEQKKLLLDKRIKDNIDVLGNKTVEILSNKKGVDLSLLDTYSYKSYDKRKTKPDYMMERIKVYKEIFERYPEYAGSFENRYRLKDGSLVSISFDVSVF